MLFIIYYYLFDFGKTIKNDELKIAKAASILNIIRNTSAKELIVKSNTGFIIAIMIDAIVVNAITNNGIKLIILGLLYIV